MADHKIFIYCERGADPTFWAEPTNAITNGAFIVAGAACLALWARRPAEERYSVPLLMALLVIVIGIGSFLFHTVAERWAALADVIPILLFMITAVYFTVRRYFGAPIWLALAAIPAFLALGFGARALCRALGECLVGSVSYMPALLVLLIAGAILRWRGHPAGTPSLLAAGVFLLSLTLRTLDRPFCAYWSVGDYALGLHFLWHVLNAVVLYLITKAAIEAPRPGAWRPVAAAR